MHLRLLRMNIHKNLVLSWDLCWRDGMPRCHTLGFPDEFPATLHIEKVNTSTGVRQGHRLLDLLKFEFGNGDAEQVQVSVWELDAPFRVEL